LFTRFKNFLLRSFRTFYENRIQLPYGIRQFLANVAFLQLGPEESVMLNPPSAYCGDVLLTTVGARPHLLYPVWLPGMDYNKATMPKVKVLVEDRGIFQVKDAETPQADWELVTIKDPRISPLKDLFLGFAFYTPLRAEMKQKA
jgi:hypothetical protein